MLWAGVIILWVALLAPFGVKRLREQRANRNIEAFESKGRLRSRRGSESNEAPSESRPMLHVVTDDTITDADVEWAAFERELDVVEAAPRAVNRYAAYRATPSYTMTAHHDEPGGSRLTMKQRRLRFIAGTLGSAVLFTLLNTVLSFALFSYIAILGWISVVAYVALALVSLSQGYLTINVAPRRMPRLASVTKLPKRTTPPIAEFYEEDANEEWRRESPRRALG